jgi:hypothetical protein
LTWPLFRISTLFQSLILHDVVVVEI